LLEEREGPNNALEWFEKEYCKDCENSEKCARGSPVYFSCILANILFEVQAFFGEAFEGVGKAVKRWRKRAET